MIKTRGRCLGSYWNEIQERSWLSVHLNVSYGVIDAQAADVQTIETSSIDDVLATTVIARCRVFAAIIGAQSAPTVSAPGDALQQSASFSHSTAGLVRFGMNVVADA